MKTKIFSYIVSGLAATFLASCASHPVDSDAYVVDRAQSRIDAIVSGDLEAAYTYYSPGYRSANSLIDFAVEVRTRRVHWTSAKVQGAECQANRCDVKVDIVYKVMAPAPGVSVFEQQQRVEEVWVNSSGEWWYVPQNQ